MPLPLKLLQASPGPYDICPDKSPSCCLQIWCSFLRGQLWICAIQIAFCISVMIIGNITGSGWGLKTKYAMVNIQYFRKWMG